THGRPAGVSDRVARNRLPQAVRVFDRDLARQGLSAIQRVDRYRVAIIAGQLVVGGAERQLYLWLSHLDRSRFEPVVVTLHPDCSDYWEGAIESLGIPLLRVARRRNPLARLLEITRKVRPYRPHR